MLYARCLLVVPVVGLLAGCYDAECKCSSGDGGGTVMEVEPNDDVASANVVPLDEGGVVIEGDDASGQGDCFRFVAPVSGPIEIRLSTPDIMSYLRFQVFDELGSELNSCTFGTSGASDIDNECTFVEGSAFTVCFAVSSPYLLQVLPL